MKAKLLVGMMCLSVFGVLFASRPAVRLAPQPTSHFAPQQEDKPRRQSKEEVKLIHSDVLYKNQRDPRADVLVGHVKLFHDGMYLDCDSARFYKEENTFNAYGHVKMVQGDTLTLTSDTLLYNGPMMQAHAMGNAVLTHRKTRLAVRRNRRPRKERIARHQRTHRTICTRQRTKPPHRVFLHHAR